VASNRDQPLAGGIIEDDEAEMANLPIDGQSQRKDPGAEQPSEQSVPAEIAG
jgi:hypothetical protein